MEISLRGMPDYKHPKIFADFLILYKKYYSSHKNLPKIFRVTIGAEIMREMSESMKLITLANLKKESKEDYEEGFFPSRQSLSLKEDSAGNLH